MSSLTAASDLVHVGMDTSKNTIVVAILGVGEQVPAIDRIFNDEVSVRRLFGAFPTSVWCGPVMRRVRAVMTCTGC